MLVAFFVAGAAFIVTSFASMFFPSGLNLFGWFGNNNNVSAKKHSLYIVSMDSFATLKEAENNAVLVMQFGASGYIWQREADFLVVGNVYLSSADAQQITTDILPTYPNAFVWEVTFPKINLQYKNYSKEQRQAVNQSLNLVNDLIKDIYEINLKLEKKEITPATAGSYINSMKSQCMIMAAKLDVINSTIIYEETIAIKNSYVVVGELLNEMLLKFIDGENVTVTSKYLHTALVKEKLSLYNKLSS